MRVWSGFDPLEERAFRSGFGKRLLPVARMLALFGAPTTILLGALDIALRHDSLARAMSIRLGLAAVLLGFWLLTNRSWGRRNWTLLWLVVIASVTVAVGLLNQGLATEDYAYGLIGYIFPIAASWVVSPRLATTILYFAASIALANLMMLLAGAPDKAIVSANGFMLGFCIVFGLGSYSVIRLGRRIYALETQLRAEQERTSAMLRSILPSSIVERMSAGESLIADRHPQVTVLFLDIVDFTRRTATWTPEALVAFLSQTYGTLDRLAETHRLEKIKTLGDAYVVAGGVADAADTALAVVRFAVEAREVLGRHADESGTPLRLRIGLATGPVVSGVIGTRRPRFDLWGVTVNRASRLQTMAGPDEILLDGATAACLGGKLPVISLGAREARGLGPVEIWRVATEGRLEEAV